MTPYRDTDGNSGIQAFDSWPDWIRIQFKKGGVYEYRASHIGLVHLEALKRLAAAGSGLSTYINQHTEVKTSAIKLSA
ncbi:MAG: hypothetical protein ABTQ25_03180 [Nitrosomonas ureae]